MKLEKVEERYINTPAGELKFVVPINSQIMVLCATCRKTLYASPIVNNVTVRVARNAMAGHTQTHLIASIGLPSRFVYPAREP